MHVLLRSLALAGLLLTTATLAHAQDSGALIMALVRKGILTDQEAEDIRAELLREAAVVPAPAFAGGKTT
ncbi:MAG: porin, partial [bacterium]